MPIYGNTCIYILIYKAVKSNDGSLFGRTSILKTCLMFVIRRQGRLTVVCIKIITWLIMISHFLRTSSYNKSNLHISLIAHCLSCPVSSATPSSSFLCPIWHQHFKSSCEDARKELQSSTYASSYWTLITVLSFCWRMARLFSVTWYPLLFQVW